MADVAVAYVDPGIRSQLKADVCIVLGNSPPAGLRAWRLPHLVDVLVDRMGWWWPTLWAGGVPFTSDTALGEVVDDLVRDGRVTRAGFDLVLVCSDAMPTTGGLR